MQTEKYNLEFEDIAYEVVNHTKSSKENKYLRLIDGMSGSFESGAVTAIMGPSGSCKTSFLNFITGHVEHSSKTYGMIKFRGEVRDESKWMKQHCYLEQDDLILDNQTVYEYIRFAVSCRRQDLNEKGVHSIVFDMMKKLHIDGLSNVYLSSLSGGERKRVMIAVEFAVGADVLILDEPTSGLDSHLALELTYMLKEYAVNQNKIVIMVIHQPGAGMFEMIDYLYFFYKGNLIYNGAVSQVPSFLESKGMLVQTTISKPELLFELFTDVSVFKEVRECKPLVSELVEEKIKESSDKLTGAVLQTGDKRISFDWTVNFRHIALICKRAAVLSLRGRGLISMLLNATVACLVACLIAFVLSIIYGAKINSFVDAGFINKSEFFTVYNLMSFSTQNYPNLLPVIKRLFTMASLSSCLFFSLNFNTNIMSYVSHTQREVRKGTYSMTTFFFAAFIIEFTFDTIRTFLLLIALSCYGCGNLFLDYKLMAFVFIANIFPKLLGLLLGLNNTNDGKSALFGVLRYLILTMMTLSKIVWVSSFLEKLGIKDVKYLLYPLLMLNGFTFWDEYFSNVFLYDLITIPGCEQMTDALEINNIFELKPSLKMARFVYGYTEDYLINREQAQSWLTGAPYPYYVHLEFALLSILLVAITTIVVYNIRFTPLMRLKHAKN